MHVVIVGGGRVGLPTALSFARVGHPTVVLDTDAERVAALAAGVLPFFEPGLDGPVFEQAALGRLRFTADPADAYADAEVAFICVETPMGADGAADLRAVFAAAETIAETAHDIVVAMKSTVPVGTGARLERLFAERAASPLPVASNPEFLKEGSALNEALHPRRILVGSGSARAKEVLRELYGPFVDDGAAWVETDLPTAELTKYASNAFLAMKISYANALAEICDAVGADVVTLTETLGHDARIGAGHLRPGMGYGGGCLSKDLAALRGTVAALGLEVRLLDEIEAINERAAFAVLAKARASLGDLRGRRVTLLGLAFKPETDDVRMAPALAVAAGLLEAGAIVTGYDPRAAGAAKRALPHLDVEPDPYRALEGADCAIVCTEWEQIRTLDLAQVRSVMARPLIIDGRNVFDPVEMAAAGFTYLGTGRSAAEGGPEPVLASTARSPAATRRETP